MDDGADAWTRLFYLVDFFRQARSKYILLLDADFVPSPDFQTNFQSSLSVMDQHPAFDKTAFVVPVFEYSEEFIKVGQVSFFH